MRIVLVVAGVLLLGGGALAGCSLGLMALSAYEPPSPDWNFSPVAGVPGAHATPPLAAGPQVVWIDQPSGHACKLVVRRPGGSKVGEDDGTVLCRVSGTASAGEVWSIEALAGPGANGCLARDEPAGLPRALTIGLVVAALVSLLGLVAIGAGVWPRARP